MFNFDDRRILIESIDKEFISARLNGEKEYTASPISSMRSKIRFERYLNGESEFISKSFGAHLNGKKEKRVSPIYMNKILR